MISIAPFVKATLKVGDHFGENALLRDEPGRQVACFCMTTQTGRQ